MNGPKILYLDIETAPNLGFTWGVYQENVLEIFRHWYILSFAAKWRGEGGFVRGLDDMQAYGQYNPSLVTTPMEAERELLLEIRALLDQADIVVAHNGVDFDFKKITARFIVHGIPPASHYDVVDTKRAIKRAASFSSNKLDWLCSQLGIGRKLKHEGFAMWVGCMQGEAKWWAKMKRYNLHDVRLLQQLHTRVAPYIKQPNGAFWGNCVNPICRGGRMLSDGIRRNKTRAYRRLHCVSCGATARGTVALPEPRTEIVQ